MNRARANKHENNIRTLSNAGRRCQITENRQKLQSVVDTDRHRDSWEGNCCYYLNRVKMTTIFGPCFTREFAMVTMFWAIILTKVKQLHSTVLRMNIDA